MTFGLTILAICIGVTAYIILIGRMFKVSRNLFIYLETSQFKEVARTIEVSMSTMGAYQWQQFKLLSDSANLILIEDYELNLSPLRKLGAETILIASQSKLKQLPITNFKKIIQSEKIEISDNGDLRITGQIFAQALIKQLEWIPSGQINISIRRPKNGFDWSKVVSIG